MNGWQIGWGLSLLVVVVGLAMNYPVSPDYLASNFSGSGPNAFMSRDAFHGFSFAMLVFINVLFALVGSRRLPAALINAPNKSYWLRPENRESWERKISVIMAVSGIATNLVLGAVLAVVIAFNHDIVDVDAVNAVVLVVVVVSFLLVIPLVLSFRVPKD